MNKLIRYDEFLLESEFNKIIEDIYFVVESKGKWVDDKTYEWDLESGDNGQLDWIDLSLKRVEEIISKIPKDKIVYYFVELVNKLTSMPKVFRKRLLSGYLSIFLSVVSIGSIMSDAKSEKINPEIRKEIIQITNLDKIDDKKPKINIVQSGSSFDKAQKLVKTAEAGYSDDREDTGNWISIPGYGKRFVGTNHGISAPILADYLGRYPKKEDMINLPYQTALKIYKKKYWDQQNLSQFKNQSISNIIYDGCVNQGQTAMRKIMRDAYILNGLDIDENNPFEKESIEMANKVDQEKLFNTIKKLRTTRYKQSPTWKKHGRGWMARLDNIKFTKSDSVNESLKEDGDYHFHHLEDDGFLVQLENDYIRIFKPYNRNVYSYSNLKAFNYDLISDEIRRYLSFVSQSEYSIDCIYVIHRVLGKTERHFVNDVTMLENKVISAIVICVK